MSKRSLFPIIPVLVVLALFAVSSSIFAQGPAGGSPEAAVSQAFTYQGQLKDSGGNPVNSTCDFSFSAWDLLSGGTQAGNDCNVAGVQVVNGYFTVQINGAGEFQTFGGDARWLQVAVRCTGDAGYTTLTPRQELTATPYALSLRPGATIWGEGGVDVIDTKTGGTAMFPNTGVYGWSRDNTGIGYGVMGGTWSTSGAGVYGTGNIGVHGETDGWIGVYGQNTSTADTGVHVGVAGETYGSTGDPLLGWYNVGVQGYAVNPDGGVGVRGIVAGAGAAVVGEADSTGGGTVGIYASAPSGQAGVFNGDVYVGGTLSKSAGSFKIDDPLDPARKYLYHSFVESPDMMNIYNGNVVLDANGAAWVQMPPWFEALNGSDPSDYRYQLTPVGGPMPNLYVAQDIQDNRFQIAGGTPGLRVSWMVTGIRHDPYAEAHRIPVEQDKPAKEQGTYLHPELYGQPESAAMMYHLWSAEPAATPSPAPAPAGQPR